MRVLEASAISITLDADGIALSQTPGGAGDLTLNGVGAASYPYLPGTGGPMGNVSSIRTEARMNPPRQVTITTASDETAKTFTVYGTDRAGKPISESMAGPSTATGTTVKIFATVTRVAVSAATTGAITVGWGATSYTRWIQLGNIDDSQIRGILVSGSATYDIEVTSQNMSRDAQYAPGNSGNAPSYTGGDQADDIEVVASAKSASFSIPVADAQLPHAYARVKMTTATGVVKLRVIKSSIHR